MDHQGFMAIEQFLNDCKSCRKCTKICPFLDAYGEPYKIINESPQDVFLCTNCTACSSVCPHGLDPSSAIFNTKVQLLGDGRIPEKVSDALNSAKGFAKRGHSFPFSYYSASDTVFWPGCGLAGTSPEIVKKTIKLLCSHLNRKVGLVLDCCFDPVYQIGDVETLKNAIRAIAERLKKNKIEHIITGCLNCTKILTDNLTDVRVQHILNVLPETENLQLTDVYLHHPCPSFKFEGLRNKAKDIISTAGKELQQSTIPSCCGFGGGLASISAELSDKFTERILKESGDTKIITYCMGCKSRFINKGKKAYHILEFISGVKPIEKPVSSFNKWKNRFLLAMTQRINTKKIIIGLFVALLIMLTTYLRWQGYISTDGIFEFLNQHKVLAPLIFILVYALGPSLFVPSLPLTLGAGFLWGPLWGVVFSITGATIGASVAFLISRYLIGNSIKEKFGYGRWKWLKEKVEKHGWKAVAFSRIVPIFPYPVLNYLFGVTPIPFLHYLWSTFIFMLPACIAYVAFGSSMGELILKGNIEGLIIGILIATAALLLLYALTPTIKKIFSEKE